MVSLKSSSIDININDPWIDQGVMGGLLTLKSFLRYFPEIDTVNPPAGTTSSHTATIQAITGNVAMFTILAFFANTHRSRLIHPGMLLWRCSNDMAR
jgi:hypothetical protein